MNVLSFDYRFLRRRVVALAVLAILLGLGTGCSGETESAATAENESAEQQGAMVLGAQDVATVDSGSVQSGIALSGSLEPYEHVNVKAQIDRKNLKRVVTISGSTTPEVSIADASAGIRKAVDAMNLPPNYEVNLGGETENLEETGGYVLESLMLAIILIFLILASQFESFTIVGRGMRAQKANDL